MLYVYHQVYRPSISVDGRTVTLIHFGEHRYLSEAYNALSRFLKDNFLIAKDEISANYVKDCKDTPYCERYITVLTARVEKNAPCTFSSENKVYA